MTHASRRIALHLAAAIFLPMLCTLACTQPQEAVVIDQKNPLPAKALLSLDEIRPVPVLPPDEAQPRGEPPLAALRFLRTGEDRFNEGLWADATAALEKALQVDPDLVDARILLARAAIQHGNHSLATSHLEEALRLAPRESAAHQLMGEIALQQRKFPQAIASFRLALAAGEDVPLRPERVLTHLSLALALREVGYLTAAAEQLRSFLEAIDHPTPEMDQHRELREIRILYRGRAPAMLGEIELELGHPDSAVAAFRRAVEESPDEKSFAVMLVRALSRTGRHDEAVERASRIVREATRINDALDLLDEIFEYTGRTHALGEQLVRIARESNSPELRFRIAERLLERDRKRDAAVVLSLLTEADPADPDAILLHARLRIELNQPDEALELLHRLVRSSPATLSEIEKLIREAYRGDGGQALTRAARQRADSVQGDAPGALLLAICELSAGRLDEASKLCREAIRLDDDFTLPKVLLARIALQARDYPVAIEYAESAMTEGPEAADLHLVRGRAYEALDEHDKAEVAFREAFRLNRKNPEALFLLAESIERRGDTAGCEQIYRRILDEVDPRFVPARERLVRLLLNSRKADRAQEYFTDFERLGQTGPAVERCRALLKLAKSPVQTGRDRLDVYRADLRRVIEQYPNEAATHLALAMSHEALGEFPEAIREAEAALAIDPDDVSTMERMSEYQSKVLDFDGAAATTLRLIEYRPNDLGYRQRLVRMSLARGDVETAHRELRALLDRKLPEEARELFVGQLVAVLRFAERFEESVEAAEKWLAEDPGSAERRELYLSALRAADRMDDAVKSAADWLAEEPNSPSLRRGFIGQLIAAQRLIEAQQHVLSWLENDPDDLELNHLLVRLFWESHDWNSAIETVRTGMEDSRVRMQYADMLGLSYRFAARWDEAIELYRRRSPGGGFDPDLINTLIEAGRFVEAEKEIGGLLSPKKSSRDASDTLDVSTMLRLRRHMARIYQLTDREMQAIQQLEEYYALVERISRLSPASSEAKDQFVGINNDLGYTLADEGVRLDDAEKMIRYAMSEEPLNAAYIDSLGWVHYKKGRFEEAIDCLRRAILLSSTEDAVMFDHLADALYRAGQIDEAKANWEKALEKTQADRFPPLIIEDHRLHAEVRRKLRQLEADEPVETAPLARPDDAAPAGAEEAGLSDHDGDEDAP